MIFIQIIGIAALLLDIFSVQFKHRKTILLFKIAANVSWVVHFFLLGAFAGAIMNSVAALRTVAYYKFQDEPRPFWVPWLFAVLAVILTVATWQGAISLLPMIAILIAIYALWQRAEQKIRFFLMLCVPPWFIYNVSVMSYAGVASDILALVSGAVALYRYRKFGSEPASKIRVRSRRKD